jgi:6-phosphogluconate dehydrogenase
LSPGDLVVNGANDRYTRDIERAADLSAKGIDYIDAGVSGGIWGLTEGYALMVGGPLEQVQRIQSIFDALAPEGGFVHAGPVGAGHYTKMVHNGIEYAMMQAYGEGYELLEACELGIDVPAALASWRYGSVVRSWLLDLLVKALEEHPGLTDIKGYADDTGEGRWTVEESIRLAVPMPAIAASLYARFSSRQDDSPTMQAVAALRQQFGGHAIHQQ